MTTMQIRNKLHQFIDSVEDKKAKAIYTMFEKSMPVVGEYSEEFKAELDRRFEEHKKDGKTIRRADMDKRIKKILNKAK